MIKHNEDEYEKVPVDFPTPVSMSALPGTQPKYSVTHYKGKFYLSGCTPPEIYERWRTCEEIAQEISIKSLDDKTNGRSHMSEAAILELYLYSLIGTQWTSEIEAHWIIRRVAQILEWPVPHQFK